MSLGEWSGAAVEPTTGRSAPVSDEWRRVELPGAPAAFAGADCVAYRTRFPDPRSGAETRGLLTLRGAYARTRVWMNGELLGEHDAYFEPARFVFRPEAENELIVECRAPGDRFGGVHDTDLVPAAAATPGIWWGVTVTGVPPVAVLDATVEPRTTDDGAFLEAAIAVDATREVEDTVTFSVRPRGFRGGGTMERAPVSLPAGSRTTVERTVEVRDARRWYPRHLGPQHRYELVAKLGDQEVSAESGFAAVERDDGGLLVNGERVRARGFAVLPSPDPLGDVERAVEANANLLRAHAHVPPRAFHRACADAGVLVWQDLPLTGEGGYDIDRGRDLAERLHRRVGHSPAVVAYGVHDDPRDLYPEPLGGGRTGRLKLRWRAWRSEYNPAPDESVSEAFPGDVPTFPVAGPVGIDPDAAHLYPGWDYGDATDVDWLLERNPDLGAVVGEFGAGALADAGRSGPSAAGGGAGTGGHGAATGGGAAADLDDVAGFDRAKHDARAGGSGGRRARGGGGRRADGDGGRRADGDVDASQAYQASVLKTVAEGLRRHDAHVLAAFALRDADDGAGMGVLARDGTEKRGFAAVADAFEPVQVVLDGPPPGDVGTTVCNDTPEPVEGTLAWTAGEEAGSEPVSVEAVGRADGPTVSVPGAADELRLELRAGDRTIENRYPL